MLRHWNAPMRKSFVTAIEKHSVRWLHPAVMGAVVGLARTLYIFYYFVPQRKNFRFKVFIVFREPHHKKFHKFYPRGQSELWPTPFLEKATSWEIFSRVRAWEFFRKMSYRGKMDFEKFRAPPYPYLRWQLIIWEIWRNMSEIYGKYEEIRIS